MTRRMWLAVLSLIGMFIAAYLSLYHFGYIGTLACTGSEGCSTVQASRWSRLLGLPVATWGLGYYVTVFVLSMVSLQDRFADSRGVSLGPAGGCSPSGVFPTSSALGVEEGFRPSGEV